MYKYLFATIVTLLCFGCQKVKIIENKVTLTVHDTVYVAKHDTTIRIVKDTLIKTWRDTVLKIIKDTLYTTKHDTTYVTTNDTVVVIKYTPKSGGTYHIMFAGTSITYGSSSIFGVPVPVSSTQTYPAQVSNFFAQTTQYAGWENFGTPGATASYVYYNELPNLISYAGNGSYDHVVVFVEAGVNDYAAGLISPSDIYAQIKQIHVYLHQKGIVTIAMSPTAYNNDTYVLNHDLAASEARRQALVKLIAAGWKNDLGAVDYLDLAHDPYIGKYSGQNGFDLAIWQPDGIHFTPLGYSIVASYVEKSIFSLK